MLRAGIRRKQDGNLTATMLLLWAPGVPALYGRRAAAQPELKVALG